MDPRYICWKEKRSRLFPLVELSCKTIASELHAQSLIENALYATIVSPIPGSSDNERTTVMFYFIEQKLRSDDQEVVTKAWKAFIKALESESIWKQRAEELEKELMSNRHLKEVDVFLSHHQKLILLVQGSLINFANQVAALDGGLTYEEYSFVTDPHSKSQTIHVNEMLTAIGNRIKQDPEVFDKVVKIFIKQGAGLKRFAEEHLTYTTLSADITDGNDDNVQVLKAFERALKLKGHLTHYMLQCLPYGPPRVGKTCLYYRLLDKPVPGKPTTKETVGSGSGSTDALTEKNMIQIEIKLDANDCGSASSIHVDDDSKWSEVPSLNDEISIYVKSIASTKPTISSDDEKKTKFDESTSSDKPAEISSTNMTLNVNPLDEAVIKTVTSHVTGKKLSELQVLLDKSITISYTDTGGQPEFHEVLPALVAGPSLFLLVFGLHQSLDSKYEVLYESLQDTCQSHESSFTVQEVLMQCLSSISSYHLGQQSKFHHQKQQKLTDCPHPPTKVLVIGTHNDLISEEQFTEIDQSLRNLMYRKSDVATNTCSLANIVEPCSDNQLVIPVNNYEKKDGSVVRKVIQRVAKRKDYKVTLPCNWLCLLLFLRQLKSSTISYEKSQDLALSLDIPEEDFKSCLHYLHYKTGNIRYYSDIDELKDIIIIKPKILFAAVTKLIMSTFTLDNVEPIVNNAFKTLGLFKLADVQEVFDKYKNELEISFIAFTALLCHLNILVDAHHENYDYFLPCALVHAPESNAESFFFSLLILFKGRFVPKGAYSGLLAYLCKLGWPILHDSNGPQLFRNKAVLDCDIDECPTSITCTLRMLPKYIEVSLKNYSLNQLHIASHYIQSIITKSMPEVLKKLQYANDWNFGVYCAGPTCGQFQKHTAEVIDTKLKVKCSATNKKYTLTGNDAFWFSDCKNVDPPADTQTHAEEVDGPSIDIRLKKPLLNDATNLLSEKSVQWDDIGRVFDVSSNFRQELHQNTSLSNTIRLERVLERWLEKDEQCTWKQFIEKLSEDLQLKNIATKTQEFLGKNETVTKYLIS